jgi:hypothetical protein
MTKPSQKDSGKFSDFSGSPKTHQDSTWSYTLRKRVLSTLAGMNEKGLTGMDISPIPLTS